MLDCWLRMAASILMASLAAKQLEAAAAATASLRTAPPPSSSSSDLPSPASNDSEKDRLPLPEHHVYAQGVFSVLSRTEFVNRSREILNARREKLPETERHGPIDNEEKELLMGLLVDVLAKDASNDTQKMLNYVKKREIDTLRRRIIPRKRHNKPGFKEPLHLNMSHIKFTPEDLKLLIEANDEHRTKYTELRETNFKMYEMEKRFLEKQLLRHYNNDAERKKEIERREKEKAEQAKIELKHPLSRDHVEEVWETKDELPREEFNVRTFFNLHDLDGNGLLDMNEISLLLENQLQKKYESQSHHDTQGHENLIQDPVERQEEMERMRQHIYNTQDTNRDLFIDYDEFAFGIANDNEKDWESLDNETLFDEEEFEQFEQQRIEEIRDSFAQGKKPEGYNYQDVPLLDGNFINETHIKYADEIIAADDTPHEIREELFKRYEMRKKFLEEQRIVHIRDPLERRKEEIQLEMERSRKVQMEQPLSPHQIETVWEKQDHRNLSEYSPEEFFHLHDVNTDGFIDKQELRLLLITEIKMNGQVYDEVERREELERMREKALGDFDKNSDDRLDLQEFLEGVEHAQKAREKQRKRNEDLNMYWNSLHDQSEFTDEEYQKYRDNKIHEIRRMIVEGMLPHDYNYTDIPLLTGNFVNATHIQKNGILINLHEQDIHVRNEDFKRYRMEERFRYEDSIKNLPEEQRLRLLKDKEEEHRKLREMRAKANLPLSQKQEEEVWVEEDKMEEDEFEASKYYALHDVDGDGEWSRQEIVASFMNELEKLYNFSDPSTEEERNMQIQKWLSYVYEKGDRNHNKKIDFEEFKHLRDLAQQHTTKEEFRKDVEEEEYTEEEFQQYKKQEHPT